MANRFYIRFTNVTIPNAAAIRSCNARFTAFDSQISGGIALNCYFVDADNPDAPIDKTELDAFSLTSGVVWNSLPSWADGSEYQTPDLTGILQTIVDRSGWESGNAVILIIEDNSSPSDVHRKISDYIYLGGSEKPALNVGWYSTTEIFFDSTRWEPAQLDGDTPIESAWSGTEWNFNIYAGAGGGKLKSKGTWMRGYRPGGMRVYHDHSGPVILKLYATDGILYYTNSYTSGSQIEPNWFGRNGDIQYLHLEVQPGDDTVFHVSNISFYSVPATGQTSTSTTSTISTTSSSSSTASTSSTISSTSSTASTASTTSTASTVSTSSSSSSTASTISTTSSTASTVSTHSTMTSTSSTSTTMSTASTYSTISTTSSSTSSTTSSTISTTSSSSSTFSTSSTISTTSSSSSTASTVSTISTTSSSTSSTTSTTYSTTSSSSSTVSTLSTTSSSSSTGSTISTTSSSTSTGITTTSSSTSSTASTISTSSSTASTVSTTTTSFSTSSTISTTSTTSSSTSSSSTASTISTTSSSSSTASTISTSSSTTSTTFSTTSSSTSSTASTTSSSSSTSSTASTISTTSTSSSTSSTASTASSSSSTASSTSTVSTVSTTITAPPTYGSDFTGGQTYSAGTSWSGYPPSRAFDNNNTTQWYTGLAGGYTDTWVQVQLSVAKTARRFRMLTDSNGEDHPEDFKLLASNTGAFTGEEVTLVDKTGVPWNEDEWRTFDFANDTPYTYYRMHALKNSGGTIGRIQVAEIELMEVLVPNNFNVAVANDSDDYTTNKAGGGTFLNYIDWVVLGDSSGTNYHSATVFRNVTIPQGATIESAFVRFTSRNTESGEVCNVKIHCEAADNATIATNAAQCVGVALTTGTNWNALPSWTDGNTYDTPDFASDLQEVIDRGGWSSGNRIGVQFIENGADSSADRNASTHNLGSGEEAAVLYVTYYDP